MDKQKKTNEKRYELLTKFKINSLEIDMIANGTPLSKLMGDKEGKKIDIAELQRIASLNMPKETVEEEVVDNSHNEFQEMRYQMYEDEKKSYINIKEKSIQNYKRLNKTDKVELEIKFEERMEKNENIPIKK